MGWTYGCWCWCWCTGRCATPGLGSGTLIALKRPSGLGFLFLLLYVLPSVVGLLQLRQWTDRPTPWHEALVEDKHEVGGKESHHPLVPPQSAHPPRSITSIQAFYQVAFNESKVSVCFATP